MPSSHRVRTRPARGACTGADISRDPDIVRSFLEDAAHFPGGRADAVAFPRSEADVSALVRAHAHVLPVGAQSSLTGGATPVGGLVLSTARMTGIVSSGASSVRVQAGVSIAALEDYLRGRGAFHPPAPTFDGAFVGGTVATNAAGAATFKYGTTRAWVRGLTVVLASGRVIEIARGDVRAHPDGFFEIDDDGEVRRVPVPRYRVPDVPKRSAGYHAEPGMDLVDLFIGSEGTLGIVTEVTLETLPRPPGLMLAFVPFRDETAAIGVASSLRDPACGIDVAAIESMDRRSLDVVREDGEDIRQGVSIPDDAAMALLVHVELAPDDVASERSETSHASGGGAPRGVRDVASERSETSHASESLQPAPGVGPRRIEQSGAPRAVKVEDGVARFARLVEPAARSEEVAIAMPGDSRRARQLVAVREAVPAGVNRRIGLARARDARIVKTAADMIVPFDRVADMMAAYREGFARRGLDYAIWGHLSDGNVHPNVIPRSAADVVAGEEAILEFGRAVAAMGGCPLAEHGVGRHPVKQALLGQLYGDEGIEEMRAVKRALDPAWKLAPGVLFSKK